MTPPRRSKKGFSKASQKIHRVALKASSLQAKNTPARFFSFVLSQLSLALRLLPSMMNASMD